MIEQEIQRKREELNESIETNREYTDIYRLSIELDDLIDEFYKKTKEKEQKKKKIASRKNLGKIVYIA